jgi:radical SAM protein with 4Fe4S-binding SPASM domain
MADRLLEANAANLIAVYPKVLQILNGELPLPEVVELFLSNYCGFACPHCRCAEQRGPASEFMEFQLLNRLLDELSAEGVKTIELGGGGEPLDHPQIGEILRAFSERGVRVGLITNGYRFTHEPELIHSVMECADWVRFSLDAVSDETYRIVHGRSDLSYAALRRVLANISARRRAKSGVDPRPKIGVKLIVQQPNEQELLKAVDEAVELGVDYLQFKWLEGHARSIPLRRRARLARDLRRRIDGLPANSIFVDVLPGYGSPQVYDRCLMSVLHPVVDWDGTIYLCAFFHQRRQQHAIGNISRARFFECWGSEVHRERIRDVNPEQCVANCPLLRYSPVIDFIRREAFRFHYV